MQCPTPDLQSIQGAYKNNVERLERSAERLSLSSDIGEAIRKIREEQKQSDSRRSSILSPHPEELPEPPSLHRQLSYASNSIVGTNSVARSGGFSPAGYFPSPRNSVRSSRRDSFRGRSLSREHRLTEVTEPQLEGKPLDSPMSTRFAAVNPASDPSTGELRLVNQKPYNLDDIVIPTTESPELEMEERQPMMADDEPPPRPSTDTARQAHGLFSDFDGVHSVAQQPVQPPDPQTEERRSSQAIQDPGLPFVDPSPHENMVYYPAPVPMMLNLPKRLSTLPQSLPRDKKRTPATGNLPRDARKSAAWLPGMSEELESRPSLEDNRPSSEYKRHTTARMPPQLRATMFFDHPAASQEVEVKGGSAVATLDSILDASAFAPVSAFTDHPIVGQAGADIYQRPKLPYAQDTRMRSSSGNLLLKKDSRATLLDENKKRNSLMSIGNYFGRRKSSGQALDEPAVGPSEAIDNEDQVSLRRSGDYHDEDVDGFIDANEDEDMVRDEEPEATPYSDQPTTLLAELQIRKHQQKSRTKTAATAFPDGMQSTLLELDAVAHVQQKARKEKRTLLAWEDPDFHQRAEHEDHEDVPLGMLYPTQKIQRNDEDRPLGLIAQRHIEDNEPLSHRRARLRGEDPRAASFAHRDTMDGSGFPNISNGVEHGSEDDDDHPGETLAERLRRIKATQIRAQPSRVSGDFTSEIMSQIGGLGPPGQRPEPEKPQAGEVSPGPGEETLGQRRKRLQAEAAARSRNVSGTSQNAQADGAQPDVPGMTKRHSMADVLQAHPSAGASNRLVSNELKYAPAPKSRNTSWAMQVNQQARLGFPQGGGDAPHPLIAGRQEKEIEKGDMINRWRQSVMH